jgi:hypothetical protein
MNKRLLRFGANGKFHASILCGIAHSSPEGSGISAVSGIENFVDGSCTSTPERGTAGFVYGLGQGRIAIFFTFPFELLLGFSEACHACCDLSAIAREPFFSFRLRHRLLV